MQIIIDEWTPLFQSLKEKVSPSGRRRLLRLMIGDIKTITKSNFGIFSNGPMRPWADELLLSESYKQALRGSSHRTAASLVRTEAERKSLRGTKWEGGTGTHLKDAFVMQVGGDSASLTNTCSYASNHQEGEGVPRRPFFPVDESGELTDFAAQRQEQIVREHFSQT